MLGLSFRSDWFGLEPFPTITVSACGALASACIGLKLTSNTVSAFGARRQLDVPYYSLYYPYIPLEHTIPYA